MRTAQQIRFSLSTSGLFRLARSKIALEEFQKSVNIFLGSHKSPLLCFTIQQPYNVVEKFHSSHRLHLPILKLLFLCGFHRGMEWGETKRKGGITYTTETHLQPYVCSATATAQSRFTSRLQSRFTWFQKSREPGSIRVPREKFQSIY